jgi:hypothetical protein
MSTTVTTYIVPGAISFVVPAGVYVVTAKGIGGGAAGGGRTTQGCGGGATGGCYAAATFAVTPGETLTGVVAAAVTGGVTQVNGNDSYLQRSGVDLIRAKGGIGVPVNTAAAATPSTSGCVGDVVYAAGRGQAASGTTYSGGGGCAAGPSGAGAAASPATATAAGQFGAGVSPAGNGGGSRSSAGNGNAGSTYGGGGSGGWRSSSTNRNGGGGAQGWIQITYDLVVTGYLSDVAGAPTHAWSLRRLDPGYSGPAVLAWKTGGATLPIGFATDGGIDTTALLAFAGGGDAFITTWYDQGSGGKNLVQADSAKMSKIVASGTLNVDASGIPASYFDGGDGLRSATASLHTYGSWFVRGQLSAANILIELSPDANSVDGQYFTGNSLSPWAFKRAGSMRYCQGTTGWFVSTTPHVGTLINSGTAAYYLDAVAQANGTETGTMPANSAVTDALNVGGRNDGSGSNCTGYISEVIIYDNVNQTANLSSIVSNMLGAWPPAPGASFTMVTGSVSASGATSGAISAIAGRVAAVQSVAVMSSSASAVSGQSSSVLSDGGVIALSQGVNLASGPVGAVAALSGLRSTLPGLICQAIGAGTVDYVVDACGSMAVQVSAQIDVSASGVGFASESGSIPTAGVTSASPSLPIRITATISDPGGVLGLMYVPGTEDTYLPVFGNLVSSGWVAAFAGDLPEMAVRVSGLDGVYDVDLSEVLGRLSGAVSGLGAMTAGAGLLSTCRMEVVADSMVSAVMRGQVFSAEEEEEIRRIVNEVIMNEETVAAIAQATVAAVIEALTPMVGQVHDLHLIAGLDASAPMTVSETAMSAGDVLLSIETVSEVVTVRRDVV